MFRKLASFFFKEEEVEIIEEDLNEPRRTTTLAMVEPLQETPRVQHYGSIQLPLETNLEGQSEKKSLMIDLDVRPQAETPTFEDTIEITREEKVVAYQRHEIISPIFGSADGSVPESRPVEAPKTRKPLTEVISPIFGKVAAISEPEMPDDILLDLDLEAMIAPEVEVAEVQLSLYDTLEGLSEYEEE